MKKFLALVLALVMTMSLVTISAGAEDFSDAEAITYTEAVEVMTAIDVIDGYTDGSFGPAGNLTRGAAAKIICNLILGPTTAGALRADASVYSDVAADHVFAPYIAYLAKEGIVSGYADGTFKPAAPLTGYAFMKMLLGVIGYDPAIEGYTGANWSINVAKQGLAIDLLDGYKGTFNGTATVNRETAMLMAFNTINAAMVKYDNKSTITVGDIVVSTNSQAETYTNNGNGIGANGEWLVRQEYFAELDLTNPGDAFERPTNYWVYDKEEIGNYPWEADVSYTTKVDGGTVYADLGLSKAATSVAVYENGALNASHALDETTLAKKDTSAKVGAQGALTEVYYDKDTNAVKVVVIDTYFGEVLKVEADDVETLITLDDAGLQFESTEFEEEDLVIYTKSVKNPSAHEIVSVAKAEKVEGVELSKYILKGSPAYVAEIVGSGKNYNTAVQMENDSANDLTTIGNVLDLYLDAYGNVIYTETTASAQKYAYVIEGGFDGNRYASGGNTYYAKVLTTEGKVEELEIGKIDGDDVAATTDASANEIAYSAADKHIVKYALNGDGNYSLTTLSQVNGNTSVDITKGTSKIARADGSAIAYGNAKTVYLIQTGDDSDPTYTAYTGYANVPSMTAGMGAAYVSIWTEGSTSVANVVFIKSADIAGGSSYIYIDGTSISGKITDANNESGYYVLPAIVDGEIKSLYIDEKPTTGCMLNATITFEDGVIDWSASNVSAYQYETDNTEDAYWVKDATVVTKLTGGILETDVDTYVVAEDVEVFQVKDNAPDAANEIVLASARSMAAGDTVSYIVEDGQITVIIFETP